jgi:stage II sporulation protein AA (anti-sigma F factor antagonist)
MEIGHKFIDDILVINLFGDLYSEQSMMLEYKLLELSTKNNQVILNCEELEYIDSKGLGVIVKLEKLLREKGGKVVICTVSGKVAKVFGLTNFEKIITVYDTVEKALKELRK